MKKIEKVSLIGLGAIGAAYAGKFYEKNPECLKIIADQKRMDRMKQGVVINDKTYHFHCVLPEEECEPADLLLIAVKFHHLEQAIQDIKNHVGPNTIILSLLNGISSEEIIGKVYGMDKMLYSMCMGIDALRENDKVSYSNLGKVYFGEKHNTSFSPKVKKVKEVFDEVGIEYIIPENMWDTLWWKFMINVGINQTSAVLKAPYGVFLSIKEAGELMESAMQEVIHISEKMGVRLKEEQIREFYDVIRKMSPHNKTSMLQDMEAHRKTEVEMFGGTVCELGKKYGVPTPINETLYRLIRVLEQKNK